MMIERTRRRRRLDWSVWMLGWQSSFFHVVVSGMSEKLMVGQADVGEWGTDGVQWYVSPGTGLRWECGFIGNQGRAWGCPLGPCADKIS